MVRELNQILTTLEGGSGRQHKVIVGFDGFIDKLVHPVSKMGAPGNIEFFKTISDFGEYIKAKANKSCSIELCTVLEKMGGNAPIFANAISKLGIKTTCIGAFGYPKMNQIFNRKNEHLEMISIAEPGYCTALEFADGKIMLADNFGIDALSYEMFQERFGKQKLCEMIICSDFIALMNWSEVLGCTSIWEGIIKDIFPQLENCREKKVFIDISDCSGRSEKDINLLLGLIQNFGRYCEVILSVNRNELECLAETWKIKGSLEEKGHKVIVKTKITYLSIHVTDGAYALSEQTCVFLPNRHVDNPCISTGGGDNFNAGLVYGLIQGMELQKAALLGNATSGYYVTHAESPDIVQLKGFISQWAAEG